MTPAPVMWKRHQHEYGVQAFYGTGAEKYGDFHDGYLNFGLWEDGITNYHSAAENMIRRVGESLGLRKNSTVLDVACGMGTQDIFLHRTFGCRIHALDVTWKHVVRTRQRVEREGLQNTVSVHHGTATQLPFGHAMFTHLMSVEGPEHFNTREAFFSEAHRVLKQKGVMTLVDYSLKRLPRNAYEHFIIELGRRLWHVPRANVDTTISYQEKLKRRGFTNITVRSIGHLCIPGYFREQQRPEVQRALRRIRGWVAAYPGQLIDYAVYRAFHDGLIDEILVRAEKT